MTLTDRYNTLKTKAKELFADVKEDIEIFKHSVLRAYSDTMYKIYEYKNTRAAVRALTPNIQTSTELVCSPASFKTIYKYGGYIITQEYHLSGDSFVTLKKGSELSFDLFNKHAKKLINTIGKYIGHNDEKSLFQCNIDKSKDAIRLVDKARRATELTTQEMLFNDLKPAEQEELQQLMGNEVVAAYVATKKTLIDTIAKHLEIYKIVR